MRYRRGEQQGLTIEMQATAAGVAAVSNLLAGALAGQVFAFRATAAGLGPVYQLDHPLSHFGLQVRGAGGEATNWDVLLEGSLDGSSWFTLLQHNKATGDGEAVFSPAGLSQPCALLRFDVAALNLPPATEIVCRAIGL